MSADVAAEEAFLVAESRFASAELAGLDEPVELFAVDPPHRTQPPTDAAAHWGEFWRELLEEQALPSALIVRCEECEFHRGDAPAASSALSK